MAKVAYERINFEAGTEVQPAQIKEDGTIQPPIFEGNTPLSVENLNKMDKAIDDIVKLGVTSNEVVVSEVEPTNEDTKLWIENNSESFKYKDPKTNEFKEISIKASDTLPIGTQVAYGGTVAPTNWLICDGSVVSRSTYADLFKVIGTSYGSGDGESTFNLPNKNGRVSVGLDSNDTDFDTVGKKYGEKEHTQTIEEMPSHNHKRAIAKAVGSSAETIASGNTSSQNDVADYGAIAKNGEGQPFNIVQPSEVDNWIIKAKQSIAVVSQVEQDLASNSDINVPSIKAVNDVVEKNLIQIALTTNQKNSTNKEFKINFDTLKKKIGNKLSFEENGVKIGSGVHCIKASLMLWTEPDNSTSQYQYTATYINKNNVNKTFNITPIIPNSKAWNTATSYAIIDVQENDLITAAAKFNEANSENKIAGNYPNSCYLIIEVLE